MTDIPLILFAKAPIAGAVKTRLQTHCSPIQAAQIAQILLETTIKLAVKAWPGSVKLAVWLDQEDDFIQTMLARYPISLLLQVAGDLGHKMHAAFEQQGYPAVIMGCDIPHCSSRILQQAHASLNLGDNVIGPSQDGGYYLLGLQEPRQNLFANIDWGQSSVFNDTIVQASRDDVEFTKLATLNDIDEWHDLLAAVPKVPGLYDLLVAEGLIEP